MYKKINIFPHGDRIYMELDDIPDKAGAIIMPGNQAEPTRIGTILECGPEVDAYKKGDRVAISSHSGTPLYLWYCGITDEKRRICVQSEILGKVVEEG
jgi:co-chaperonin GroES (HSP10)